MRSANRRAAVVLSLLTSASAKETLLNSDWRFQRGFASGWSFKTFDDSHWRQVELPHDYSIEDLPPRETDSSTPVLAVRKGTWKFFEGAGNSSFADQDFDDSHWKSVQVPADWRTYGVKSANAKGWFRRKFTVTESDIDAANDGQLFLALGTIVDSDITYVNGQEVGTKIADPKAGPYGMGCKNKLTYRSYGGMALALRRAIKLGSENVVAVYVTSYAEQIEGGKPGGLFDTGAEDIRVGAFDAGASPGQRQTGYTVGGVGIYRKAFTTSASAYQEVFFEGCYMNCEVVLNGHILGTHPYGYTSFSYDVSKALAPVGQKNVLAVLVNNSGANSRWYSGSGLYRGVSLLRSPSVHLKTWGGLHITTSNISSSSKCTSSPSAPCSTAEATVSVALQIENTGSAAARASASVRVWLSSDTARTVVARTATAADIYIAAAGSANVSLSMPAVQGLQVWGPAHPATYTAEVTVTATTAASTSDGVGGSNSSSSSSSSNSSSSNSSSSAAPSDAKSNVTSDVRSDVFGVRTFSFDAATGFTLNGERIKLYGGCVHHDNGPLGAKAIAAAEERRVRLLKANGYNAIRTSHNPVSRAFVAACDKHGVLLMEEAFDCWDSGKNPDDYHNFFEDWWRRDVASMVLRDRNRPSIVMWSIGNEIPDRATSKGVALSKTLSNYIRALDPAPRGTARAITSAYPGVSGTSADAYFAPLDVAGYNYSPQQYAADHARAPGRVMVATETFPADSFTYWSDAWSDSYVVGNFIWTAIDYIGESAIGANGHNTPALLACGEYCAQPYPYHVSFCGDLSIVGGQKPQAFYRRVLWNSSKLEMAVHSPVVDGSKEVVGAWGYPDERQSWSWGNTSAALDVNVYSNHECVKLFLNGEQQQPPTNDNTDVTGCVPTDSSNRFTATFKVKYAPGLLRAVSYIDGQPQSNVTFTTAGRASKLRLVVDRMFLEPSRADLAYVVAEVVDDGGVLAPCSHVGCEPPTVTFEVSGAGSLEATGSGDPVDPSSFSAASRKTYRGRATAIVRPGKLGTEPSGGTIVVRASSPGLESSTIRLAVSQ